jgi:RNA ligase
VKIDMKILNEYVEAGKVNKQTHPSLPLSIYKYSRETVYTHAWDEITLRCRGVVLDEVGNVVINGFPKFFNHDESDGKVAYGMHKDMPYTITEKLDGSLIQVARWNGHLVITSSGSFTSPQAQKAKLFLEKYEHLIGEYNTYIFEIIYPENRIVLDYKDKQALTLLAVRNTETGLEFPLGHYEAQGFDVVKTVDMTLEHIEAELPRAEYINAEGYIAKFADGYRVKFKYSEYMRLHKIVSGVNEKFIWEALRDKVSFDDILSNIPDELYNFISNTRDGLLADYAVMEFEAKEKYELAIKLPTRKEQAQWVMSNEKKLSALIFSMLDSRDYSDKIWKMLEPKNITRTGMGETND